MQRNHANGQRQRHRHHHHDRSAKAKRQQRQQHHQEGDAEVAAKTAEPVLDGFRLVETAVERDIGRQRRLECVNAPAHAADHVKDGFAQPCSRAHEQRALAIVTGEVRALAVRPGNLRDIADGQHGSAARAQGHAPDFVETVERAGSLEIEAAPARFHRANRRIPAFALQRLGDRRERQTIGGEAVKIGGDAYLRRRRAPHFGLLYARRALDGVPQRGGVGFHLPERRVFAGQRHLHDAGLRWAEATGTQRHNAIGQARAHDIQFAHDLAEFLLRIDAPGEFH